MPLMLAMATLLSGCSVSMPSLPLFSMEAAGKLLPWSHTPAPAASAVTGMAEHRTRTLALQMQLSPVPVRLSETRQITARLQLTNCSGKYVQMEFPTTQRIDVVVTDANGRTLSQWSEDRLFENEPTLVGINPGEHVEYSVTIPTRDWQPGRPVTVKGFFPTLPGVQAEVTLIPES